jgi:hypothetical protein
MVRIIACLLFFLFQAQATTVVVIRTPKRITVGADSLVTALYPNGQAPFYFHACKIFHEGNIWFALIGVPGGDPEMKALVRKALAGSHSLDEGVRALKNQVRLPFAQRMTRFRTDFPKEFRKRVKLGKPMSILLVAAERGVPKYAWVGLELIHPFSTIEVAPRAERCPGNSCSGAEVNYVNIKLLGNRDAANRTLSPEYVAARTETRIARELIAIEAASDSADVGEPSDILTIDSSGAHRWEPPVNYCH